jgi:hypothetical protein
VATRPRGENQHVQSGFEANDCAFIADKSSYLFAAIIMTNLPGEHDE